LLSPCLSQSSFHAPTLLKTSLIHVSTMICSVEFESQAQSSLCLRYHVVCFLVILSVHGFAKPTDAFYASHLRMFISSCCSSGTWCLCIVGCARFNLTCHDIESDDTVHVLHVYFRDKLLLSSNHICLLSSRCLNRWCNILWIQGLDCSRPHRGVGIIFYDIMLLICLLINLLVFAWDL
jgi:hypothetical protein